jgi:outer membrane protein OmpA-like peptidoglycan-associated protein
VLNFKNSLLAATVLLAVPQIAQAQPINGVYIGAGGGINFLQNENVKANSLPVPVGSVHTTYQPGWAALGSIGYGFGNGWRAEVEGNYSTNHLRTSRPISGNSSSSEEKYGAMFNALYDFNQIDIGVNAFGISPYLGVGGGFGQNKWINTDVHDRGRIHISNGQDTAAVQAIAGLAFPIAAVPGLAITAEYRVIDEPGSRKYDSVYTSGSGVSASQTKVGSDINQSVLIGLRYALYTAPAVQPAASAPVPVMAAVPAAAPAPSHSYLLFFDWDRADLSLRATQIIAEAAQNSTKVRYTKIDVQGHADLTGTHAYNQGLSLLRANAVAVQLVKDGVPETVIVITALGDTQPLVPTAPGVREPQNRRVEIIIR